MHAYLNDTTQSIKPQVISGRLPDRCPTITGKALAYGGRTRTAPESGLLGAQLHLNRLAVRSLTIKQSAYLAGCSWPYVAGALAIIDDQAAIDAVLAGRVSLLDAQKAETLADHFLRSDKEERLAMARAAGVSEIWDQLVLPLIG